MESAFLCGQNRRNALLAASNSVSHLPSGTPGCKIVKVQPMNYNACGFTQQSSTSQCQHCLLLLLWVTPFSASSRPSRFAHHQEDRQWQRCKRIVKHEGEVDDPRAHQSQTQSNHELSQHAFQEGIHRTSQGQPRTKPWMRLKVPSRDLRGNFNCYRLARGCSNEPIHHAAEVAPRTQKL